MKRLSSVLHALLHMAEHGEPLTSEHLANCTGINPVVVRRTMGLLRNVGLGPVREGPCGRLVARDRFECGHSSPLDEALGEPAVFAIGNRNENPDCLVEQSVNAVLDEAFAEAKALLLDRFGAITLADLSAEFSPRHAAHRKGRNRNAS
jgi:DNA-binding IscR family transcriptional regulator